MSLGILCCRLLVIYGSCVIMLVMLFVIICNINLFFFLLCLFFFFIIIFNFCFFYKLFLFLEFKFIFIVLDVDGIEEGFNFIVVIVVSLLEFSLRDMREVFIEFKFMVVE